MKQAQGTGDGTMGRRPKGELRRGWTTGACAAAATKAAYLALLTGRFPDPVSVRLPGGEQPRFDLAESSLRRDRIHAAARNKIPARSDTGVDRQRSTWRTAAATAAFA